MNNIFYKVFFLLFVSTITLFIENTYSQSRYGNEWINFNQDYFKIKIPENRIYKIDYQTLINSGIPVSSIHPGRFQLFFRGIEQKIAIYGDQDGSFYKKNLIYFYGKKNDGALDSSLYIDPSTMPHKFYSLYTDTSAYFLTYSTDPNDTNHKRIIEYSKTDYTNFTPELNFNYDQYQIFTEQYFQGELIISTGKIYKAMYDNVEGWFSNSISMNQSRTIIVQLPGVNMQSSPAFAEIVICGESLNESFDKDHHLQIDIGSLIGVVDSSFKGFTKLRFNLPVAANLIDTLNQSMSIKIKSLNVAGLATNSMAISFIKINYPRKFDFQNTSKLNFRFRGNNSGTDYFLFKNYQSNRSHPVIWDIKVGKSIYSILNGDTLNILLPDDGQEHEYFIIDSMDITTVIMENVSFQSFNPSSNNYDFIIVSHPKLYNASQQYSNYRNSTGFNTLMADINQIYNQFYYGIHHPLAIRHFVDFLYQNSSNKPQYLLLLGKGYETSKIRSPSSPKYDLDLVPSIGMPPTDNFFSSGIDLNKPHIEEKTIVPALATGRLAATNETQILDYLNKLMEYENTTNEFWRKNILHIGGGQYSGEQTSIRNALNQAKQVVEDKPFGGSVIEIFNKSDEPVTYDFRDEIQSNINNGLNLFTYFGHGSLNVLGIDIGQAQDLNNNGKYSVMYMNGCNVGNPNSNASLGENFIFQADKGAIGWLAHSTTTTLYDLSVQINRFYENLFNSSYSESIGKAIQQTIGEASTSSLPSREFYTQWIYQGDPALKIYTPEKADYFTTTEDISVYPSNPIATDDSFALRIILKNKGLAVDSLFSITIQRIFPDNIDQQFYTKINIPTPFYQDTFDFYMVAGGSKAQGLNKFIIYLNSPQTIEELDYNNNIAYFEYYISGSGTRLIFPIEYSIEPEDSIQLVVQDRNLLKSDVQTYLFEIDTSDLFNSPLLKSSPEINSDKTVIEWKTSLLSQDSIVYYWRAKIKNPENFKEEWSERSFINIKNSPSGWSQSHFPQFYKMETDNIVLDTLARTFRFVNFSRTVTITASRWRDSNIGIRLDNSPNLNPGVCVGHDIVIIQFDKNSLNPSEITRRCNGNMDVYYRSFDMDDINHQNSLKNYIDTIPKGNYIALFTKSSSQINNWPIDIKNSLQKVGATNMLTSINNGFTAYTLLGIKGEPSGFTIAEDTVHEPIQPPDPSQARIVEIDGKINGIWHKGNIKSEPIGPSIKWSLLYHVFEEPELGSNDDYNLKILGINQSGEEILLKDYIKTYSYDLTSVDAVTYPYIRLQAILSDNIIRTPLQLNRWQVIYDKVPEGTIINDNLLIYHSDTLEQGDSFSIQVAFKNISELKMDSILYEYQFENNRIVKIKVVERVRPLEPDSMLIITKKFSTFNNTGYNNFIIRFNPDFDQPELTLANNYLVVPFYVKADKHNPILDVTFDGRHIVNGELVSAKPLITIVSKDENSILLQDDTSTFSIYLKKPSDIILQRISFDDPQLTFLPASTSKNKAIVEYHPLDLQNGLHTLTVQARDKVGNPAGENMYSIDFDIVTKSTISNFFPYPNPFSDKCRFVFTLTGSEIPEEIKIQIITISGRVVKEITQDELGPIHIGHNISDYYWNGRDEYGDILANGVYLYRITVKQSGHSMEKYKTSADKYFKNNMGKLYILR